MGLIADLHVHSRFSRATSKDLDFVRLYRAACKKGIGLVGTGDFTHPGWLAEIEEQLELVEGGLLRLRPELERVARQGLSPACEDDVRFVLEVEISCIYKCGDRVRKNHNLVFVPSLDAARRLRGSLSAIGNLGSDGRPILGLDARDLLEITLETDPLAFLIPAHIWTPWFSMLGSKSGFDSLDECFRDLAQHVFAVETGLSSDPPMNWRVSSLDRLTLVSNSDAHSPANLGREANLLDIEPSFGALREALRTRQGFGGTIEFFPEEGKYHLDGHRKCGVRLEPERSRELGGRCPACGGLLTVGVSSRVLDLADRPDGERSPHACHFQHLVPLSEVIGELLGVGSASKKVATAIERLRASLGPELVVLKDTPLEDVSRVAGAPVAEAIRRVRAGELSIAAGYDGEFGTVQVFAPDERDCLFGQLSFFPSQHRESAQNRSVRPQSSAPAPRAPSSGDGAPPPVAADDPLAGLDPDQRLAATLPRGPLLVVAGPGTGKTRTLVARIVHQVRNGVDPRTVLAVTFTNQAAEELAERLTRALPGGDDLCLTVATFHALGLDLLRELDGGEPKVIDAEERRALGEELFPGEADELLARVSFAKQRCDPEAALRSDPRALAAFNRYQGALGERALVDLDDLVLRPCELLGRDPEVALRLAQRFQLVCVDEYQDVNEVQAQLVRILSPDGATLCAIGDPDQAIYGFRGADPAHFAGFEAGYPGTTRVELQTTYRLTRPLAAAAAQLLGRGDGLIALRDGPAVEVVACATPAAEAEQILIRLEAIVGGSSTFAVDSGRGGEAELDGVAFGDLAVLCRTRAQRGEILTALGRSGIPCRSVGEDEAHDPRSHKVAVMTMHAAKGREFEVVFIAGVERGLLPLEARGRASDPEEERRLLFVALTRARRLAVISHAAQRSLWGERLPGGPSRFLADLAPAVVLKSACRPSAAKPPGRQLRLF